MRSAIHDILPAPVRRSLITFGADISIARRKRRLTLRMMAERLGVSMSTYRRVEQGDPTVTVGVHAMVLFVLGLGTPMAQLADQSSDDVGLLLDTERLPKRVRRVRGSPQS